MSLIDTSFITTTNGTTVSIDTTDNSVQSTSYVPFTATVTKTVPVNETGSFSIEFQMTAHSGGNYEICNQATSTVGNSDTLSDDPLAPGMEDPSCVK